MAQDITKNQVELACNSDLLENTEYNQIIGKDKFTIYAPQGYHLEVRIFDGNWKQYDKPKVKNAVDKCEPIVIDITELKKTYLHDMFDTGYLFIE